MKLVSFSAILLPLVLQPSAYAQLSGHNTKGDFGLLAGTQAPPGFYVIPMFYDYTADTFRDSDGDGLHSLVAADPSMPGLTSSG